jgi:hypothetical protein
MLRFGKRAVEIADCPVSNPDVLTNAEGAARHILAEAAEYLGGTHPHPSLAGRGD